MELVQLRKCLFYLWIFFVADAKIKSPVAETQGVDRTVPGTPSVARPNIVIATDDAGGRPTFRGQNQKSYTSVCPVGCSTCSAYNGCVTCHKRHYLFLQWIGMRQIGNCVSTCPDGYYGKRRRKHGKCLKCAISRCEACSNGTSCSRCSYPFLVHHGKCVEVCPATQPYVSNDRQCLSKINCEVSGWSVWGSCTRKGATCGYKNGLQMRSRDIVQQPSDNGQMCPSTVQYRKCQMKHRICEDVETNESDLSKISRKIKEQKKKLQILLAKHRKRKQQIEKNKNKNRKDKHSHDDDDDGDDVNDDIISQQTGETNVSLQDFKIL